MKQSSTRILLIVLICILAALAAWVSLAVANETLSLADADISHDVTVSNPTPVATANQLAAQGVIRYPVLFALYTRVKGNPLQEGEYTVSEAMSYTALLNTLSGNAPKIRHTVTITFPEGITVPEILDRFEAAGVGNRERFEAVIAEGNFAYDFLPDATSDRHYRLEGYLYPDTYEFFSDTTEEAAIDKMLSNFDRKFDARYRERCQTLGKTVDEVITLASMVQAEGKYADEYARIAAVFANRLNNSSRFPYLESDATVRYAVLKKESVLRKVTAEDLLLEDSYNTYQKKGLPPGTIANPGIDAINAALFPEKTREYYFVSIASGRTLFAKSYTEHLANIARAKGKTA